MYPPVIYLTDCFDDNAQARISARTAALFGQPPAVFALSGPSPESLASLTLLDTLLSMERLGEAAVPTITLVNIAPRNGEWPNGAPFCFFRYGPHLVVSTLNFRVLALTSKHLGVQQVYTTDIRTTLNAAAQSWAALTPREIEEIATSQFRSLWYVTLLAKWLADGRAIPAEPTLLPGPEDEPAAVCVVDNFGNCKLDRTPDDLGVVRGSFVKVLNYREDSVTQVPFYNRLSEVPAGETALVVGSSGVGLAELIVAGGSAAARLGLHEGMPVFP